MAFRDYGPYTLICLVVCLKSDHVMCHSPGQEECRKEGVLVHSLSWSCSGTTVPVCTSLSLRVWQGWLFKGDGTWINELRWALVYVCVCACMRVHICKVSGRGSWGLELSTVHSIVQMMNEFYTCLKLRTNKSKVVFHFHGGASLIRKIRYLNVKW